MDDLRFRKIFNLGITKDISGEKLSKFSYQFTHVIQKYTNLPTLKGYIFHILQHFATKLCNITNFKMLLLAVVIDFILLA